MTGWGFHPFKFLRTLISGVTIHHTMLTAAGVAFYAGLALVPTITGVVSVYGLVAEPEDVNDQLESLTDALPQEAADLVVAQLEGVTRVGSTGNIVGLAVSVFGLLWLISNAFNAMVMAIRLAYERPSPHNWVQGRLFALLLSAGAVIVVATLIWLVFALPLMLGGAGFDATVESVIETARFPLALLLGMMAMSILYRLVVGRRRKSKFPISIGAIAGTVMWIAGTIVMGMAMSNVDRLESTFGSLSAVAVLFLWLYLSAAATLLGAEIDATIARGPDARPTNLLVRRAPFGTDYDAEEPVDRRAERERIAKLN